MAKLRTIELLAVLLACASFAAATFAAQPDDGARRAVAQLQKRWAEIQYRMPEDERAGAFEQLVQRADEVAEQYSGKAAPLIWKGIILSTYAGAEGGLSALSIVDDAKKALEKALALEPEALAGSAYTSLGALYYQVPGWPIAFGDDAKARKLLKTALGINPTGIDPNYFYGDFLKEQGEYRQASKYLEKALNAPDRPNRPLADQGRRQQIRKALKQVNDELS